jgi:hypothetical protein
MDLGFLCEEGVHCCYLGVINYLLFCHIICMRACRMKRFYVDDNYVFKKERKTRD